MHRFFCEFRNISLNEIQILDKDEVRHIVSSLRLKINDKVVAIDGHGNEFSCEISYLDKKKVELKILEKKSIQKEDLYPQITVACAIPKKSKIDFIVEKLVELGASRIILLKTERTEIILKDADKKIERLLGVAKASLKQSGNLFLPEINYLSFKQLIKFRNEAGFDLALIPNLVNKPIALKDVLKKDKVKKVLIAIGPEGDFSKEELGIAIEAGFVPISLGSSVLKVDTAAISAVAFIKLSLEDAR